MNAWYPLFCLLSSYEDLILIKSNEVNLSKYWVLTALSEIGC